MPRPPLRRVLRFLVLLSVTALILPWILVLPLIVFQPPTTTIILARSAQRLFAGKRPAYPSRNAVARNEISPHLRRAVLAFEDDRFYLHNGFDFEEIENALERSRRGRRLRGASTVTQQTAKNLFLWEGRSFVRKGLEAYVALILEVVLSKDRILDLYLNLAEWGDGAFGAEAGARMHFRKSAARLTRDEATRLAAILPAPRRWSPHGSIARRRAAVIAPRMYYAAPREAPAAGASPSSRGR